MESNTNLMSVSDIQMTMMKELIGDKKNIPNAIKNGLNEQIQKLKLLILIKSVNENINDNVTTIKEHIFNIKFLLGYFTANEELLLNLYETLCGIEIDINLICSEFSVGKYNIENLKRSVYSKISFFDELIAILYSDYSISGISRKKNAKPSS